MLHGIFRWAATGLIGSSLVACTANPPGGAGAGVDGASGDLGFGGSAGEAPYLGVAGANTDYGGSAVGCDAGGRSAGGSAGASTGGAGLAVGGGGSSGTSDSGSSGSEASGSGGTASGGTDANSSGTGGGLSGGGSSGAGGSEMNNGRSGGASGAGGEPCLPPLKLCDSGKVCNAAGLCVPKLCEPLPANVPNCVADFPCHIGHCSSADQPCTDLTVLLGLGFAPDGIACGSIPGATCQHGNCLTAQCGAGLYCDPSCTGLDGTQLSDGTLCKTNFVCLTGLCTSQLNLRAAPFVLATNLSISTTLASFTDAFTTETSAAFTAMIDWGDGTTSAGVVSGAAGFFSVAGTHTYATHAPVRVAIAIKDVATTSSAAVTFSTGYVLDEFPVQNPVGIASDNLNVIWATQQSPQIAQLSYQGVPTEFTAPAGTAITHTLNNGLWYLEPTKIAFLTSDEDLNGGPTAIVVKEWLLPGLDRMPAGITVDSAGLDAWFTETGRIARITQAGTITEYTIPTPASDPRGITLDSSGNVWFTEYAASKIGMTTPSGVITEFATLTPLSYPDGIAGGSDGAVWFTEAGKNAIARITPAGAITEYPLPTAAAFPHAIVLGLQRLWFTEPGANKIGTITLQGQITEYPVPTSNGMPWDLAVIDGIWFTERAADKVGHLQTGL